MLVFPNDYTYDEYNYHEYNYYDEKYDYYGDQNLPAPAPIPILPPTPSHPPSPPPPPLGPFAPLQIFLSRRKNDLLATWMKYLMLDCSYLD